MAAGSDGFSVKPSPFCSASVSWAAMRSTSRSKWVRSLGSHAGALRGLEQDVQGPIERDAGLFEVTESQLALAEGKQAVGVGHQCRRGVNIDGNCRHGRRECRRLGRGDRRRGHLRRGVTAAGRREQEDCNGQPERSSHMGAPLPDRG